MPVVRQNSTATSSDSDVECDGVVVTAVEMTSKCQDRQHPQQQQQQPRRRHQSSTRFKNAVRRVLVALSFHIGRRPAETPASLPTAETGDDCFDGVDGCGGLIMTSTSTVTTTVCRLAAVEEEQRSRCNSLVSTSANCNTASCYDHSSNIIAASSS